ncbi:N-acetylglucosamine-6-phosphate deacetylase [Sporosalibacterium faouarense]|uniref:N-acetylglucosamine-6-phosphate deacetylase n=1 Tax=Sporosalibacterium faouarense TaxID=516123 RepID=UPI00192C0F66|nr:N-acetylglucosamine-6-phosphate deacetylase [Sporosalibacterium faouarense]
MKYYLKCNEIFHETGIVNNQYLLIENEYIKAIHNKPKENIKVIDLGLYKAIPGLIDLHIHGANGFDVMDCSYEALNEISKYLARYGVTSFLATTLTAPLRKIKDALINVKESLDKELDGAVLLGTYLEGPYLTEKHKGAHPAEYMRSLNQEEIANLINLSNNTIKIMTVAPDKENSNQVIKYLRENNINVSIGHTNATYDETMEAFDSGANIGVHTFNGMRGLHHREPGVVGAIMNHEKAYAELIADNIHVHPSVMNILYKIKGTERICLISDCMRAGGLPDGEYMLGELEVIVKDSIAKIETGSLAGSTLKLIDAIRNIVNATGIDIFEGIKMATLTPASVINFNHEIGSIKENKKADIAIVDNDLNVVMTIVGGKIVYSIEELKDKY